MNNDRRDTGIPACVPKGFRIIGWPPRLSIFVESVVLLHCWKFWYETIRSFQYCKEINLIAGLEFQGVEKVKSLFAPLRSNTASIQIEARRANVPCGMERDSYGSLDTCDLASKRFAFCLLPSQQRRRPGSILTRLDGWPVNSPTDALPSPTRMLTQCSRPVWFAVPSPGRTFTNYSLPVSPRTPKYSGHYLNTAACVERSRQDVPQRVFCGFAGGGRAIGN
jgi:hypothetical protein